VIVDSLQDVRVPIKLAQPVPFQTKVINNLVGIKWQPDAPTVDFSILEHVVERRRSPRLANSITRSAITYDIGTELKVPTVGGQLPVEGEIQAVFRAAIAFPHGLT
jgi:hypothetical protein